jgi:geranylgeranyl diphosphate synthase, type II
VVSCCGRWISREVSESFAADRALVEQRLDEICSNYLVSLDAALADAVRYALQSPGKRIRPLLLQFAYRAVGGAGDASLLACAPEVIHSYSLVHDDLPCMDDDDMRRGRPTVHRVYGTRTAILAGALMIPLAARVATAGLRSLNVQVTKQRASLEALLVGAGSGGMIGGQLRDLTGEGLSLSLAEREAIHSAKTGALIVASVRMGAVAAGAHDAQITALTQYAHAIGLAFQIMDDVLDVTSTTTTLGKTAGRDAALGKSTYPALLGVDAARRRAQALIDHGLESLAGEQLLTQELAQVANFMVTRTS